MHLAQDSVLQEVRPLHGIPESGLHWYLTFLDHYKVRLGMSRATTDRCILVRNGKLRGEIGLQVDDTMFFGEDTFLTWEERDVHIFKVKSRTFLLETVTPFNGFNISINFDTVSMTLTVEIQQLEVRREQ